MLRRFRRQVETSGEQSARASPSDPVEVGRALRTAREQRGLELSDVARRTDAPTADLAALEEGELERLRVEHAAAVALWRHADAVGLAPEPLVSVLRSNWPADAVVDTSAQRASAGAMPLANLSSAEALLGPILGAARPEREIGLSDSTKQMLKASSAKSTLNEKRLASRARKARPRAERPTAIVMRTPSVERVETARDLPATSVEESRPTAPVVSVAKRPTAPPHTRRPHRFSRYSFGQRGSPSSALPSASLLVVAVGLALALDLTVSAGTEDQVNLGSADSYAVLAGSAISNVGNSVIVGDIGVSPGDSVTGFPQGSVSGSLNVANAAASQAQAHLATAYYQAQGEGPASSTSATALGADQTVKPGVYKAHAKINVSGALTLNAGGDPNAVWLFQAGSSLNVDSATSIMLRGGAMACHVFWQVSSSATIGNNAKFVGSILALNHITVDAGATVDGRLLARNGSVTLDDNTIAVPSCSTPATSTSTATTTTLVPTSTTTTTAPPPTTSPTNTTPVHPTG